MQLDVLELKVEMEYLEGLSLLVSNLATSLRGKQLAAKEGENQQKLNKNDYNGTKVILIDTSAASNSKILPFISSPHL